MNSISPALAASAAICLGARGGVINVPADHPTIQAAIAASVDGEEIVVAPGTYHEAISFMGKDITLRSAAGPEATRIDSTGLGLGTVRFVAAEGPPFRGAPTSFSPSSRRPGLLPGLPGPRCPPTDSWTSWISSPCWARGELPGPASSMAAAPSNVFDMPARLGAWGECP